MVSCTKLPVLSNLSCPLLAHPTTSHDGRIYQAPCFEQPIMVILLQYCDQRPDSMSSSRAYYNQLPDLSHPIMVYSLISSHQVLCYKLSLLVHPTAGCCSYE